MIGFFFRVLMIISPLLSLGQTKRIACYYVFPTAEYGLLPEDIDPNLCTHIIVGVNQLTSNKIELSESERNTLRRVLEIKKKKSSLLIMLSVGGGNQGNFGFPEMVRTQNNRDDFINSFRNILNEFNLDGLDLDWEFPNEILKNQKEHFTELLQEIRNDIEISPRKYLISVAVAAPITFIEASYDIPEMNRLVDFINVMSYDYNFFSYLTPWTGINAPLYARSNEFLYFATQNINYTSHYYLKRGMSKEKVNIGLPVYAHTYTLASSKKIYIGAPAIGNGAGDGSIKYGEVCDFMKNQKLTPIFDNESKSPYVTNGSEWISFENDLSMKFKAEFVRDSELNVMIFSLSSDDYEGKCSEDGRTFPNIKMIHNTFMKKQNN